MASDALMLPQVENMKACHNNEKDAKQEVDIFVHNMDIELAELVAGMPPDATHFRWAVDTLARFINRKDHEGAPRLPNIVVRGTQANHIKDIFSHGVILLLILKTSPAMFNEGFIKVEVTDWGLCT